MDTVTIVLLVMGVAFLLAEPVVPGMFISVVGVFFLVLAGFAAIDPSSVSSPIAVVSAFIASLLAFAGLVLFYKRYGGGQPPETMVASSMVGKRGIVKEKVIPDSLDGKVEINNTMWSATADREIEKGTHVVVVESEGVHVKVKPIEETDRKIN